MTEQDIMNTLYDIVANNEVTQAEREDFTQLVDYVDLNTNTLALKLEDGTEYALQLVKTYAPVRFKVDE